MSYEVELGTAPDAVVRLTDGTSFYNALSDAQLRASPVPVSVSGGGGLTVVDQGSPNLDANSWPVHQVGALPAGTNTIGSVISVNSLVPKVFDYIQLGYTGANITTVLYKTGGSSGTLVATLTLVYSGSTLTSVTRT